MSKQPRTWDSFWLGLLLGLILPAIFCVVYYYTISLDQFIGLGMLEEIKPIIGRMLLLGTFANMAVMFILYELNAWQLAKGMMAAIFPYMLAGIILI